MSKSAKTQPEFASEQPLVVSSPSDVKKQARNLKSKFAGLSKNKKYALVASVVLILLGVFLVAFLIKRGMGLRNLAPNPSFERGSGDKPAGWTTK